MIIQVLGAFIAVAMSSVVFRVPRHFILYAGLTGAVGQLIFLMSTLFGVGEVISSFLGSMVVALIAHSLARVFKAPVTIFFIPGILPMVPGLGLYRAVYYFIIDSRGLASFYLVQTIQIAGMIALAIFIVDSVFRIFQKNN
jgi:uncharacterized membrane protein YjjB (DUF3815 family)